MPAVFLLWVKCADYLYSVLFRSIMLSITAVKRTVCWLWVCVLIMRTVFLFWVTCADYVYSELFIGKVC